LIQSGFFNKIPAVINMKSNSNYPEENMIKLISPKYFTGRIHTTNVITLFTTVTRLHVSYKMPDKNADSQQNNASAVNSCVRRCA
jgi:hypothetical protein